MLDGLWLMEPVAKQTWEHCEICNRIVVAGAVISSFQILPVGTDRLSVVVLPGY